MQGDRVMVRRNFIQSEVGYVILAIIEETERMSGFETIAPTVPLTKEQEALLEFLTYQKPAATGGREFNELAHLSEKALETKIRELENWNFRLNLDEAKELQDSVNLGIVESSQSAS